MYTHPFQRGVCDYCNTDYSLCLAYPAADQAGSPVETRKPGRVRLLFSTRHWYWSRIVPNRRLTGGAANEAVLQRDIVAVSVVVGHSHGMCRVLTVHVCFIHQCKHSYIQRSYEKNR